MSDDLSQLDALIESDVLEALGCEPISTNSSDEMAEGLVQNVPEEYFSDENNDISESSKEPVEVVDESEGEILEDIGDIEILPLAEIESALDEQEEEKVISANSSELLSVLTQLLNNKTIEITIKIKD
ncbi:MAG: hypothetical protein U9O56_06640 [Campylobacterota bacterium]|nr:hypothetical protein [Campylobacterota bacterium]